MSVDKSTSVNVKETLPKEVRDEMLYPNKKSIPLDKLGFNGGDFPDCTPEYVPLKRAKVIKKYDSYIVLGGDAPNGPGSGYSSFGARCSSIDMVVGRLSANVEASTNPNSYCVDNYDLDAARIHISQRTDVDENFALKDGSIGNAKARSAIGMKADGIRIIGREGIKLVTSQHGEPNSQGGKNSSGYGIELIAKNDDSDLQPIPKGDNLVKHLELVQDHIKNIYEMLEVLSTASSTFATTLAAHTHISAAGPVSPSIELTPAAINLSRNMIKDGVLTALTKRLEAEIDELNGLYDISLRSINSELNKTN